MQPDHEPAPNRQRQQPRGSTRFRVALLGVLLAGAVLGAARYLQPQPPSSRILVRSAERFTALAFSPDGQRVAVADESGKLALNDVNTALRVWSAKTDIVTDLTFSRDGRRLCDGNAVWIIPPGHRWLPFGVSSDNENLVLSPNGRHLAFTDRQLRLYLYDVEKQERVRIGTGYATAFSPNGEIVAVGKVPAADGYYTEDFWSISVGKPVRRLGAASFAAFSPDGRLFAADLGLQYQVRRMHDGALVREYQGSPTGFAFSSDSDRVAVAHAGMIDLCRISTGKREHRLRLANADASVDCLAFSPDGRYLASASEQEEENGQKARFSVRLWRLAAFPPVSRGG